MSWDAAAIRDQFPIANQEIEVIGGKKRPLVYLDHGASTHAPRPVLNAYTSFLEHHYANIHRGHHTLSLQSSELFDEMHDEMAAFVGGSIGDQHLLLAGNTTQALDMAAWIMRHEKGDTAVSLLEHHSNDLPHRRAGKVVHFGASDDGRIDFEHLEKVLEGDIKLLAVTGASNVSGYLPPIHKMARMAHDAGARILVDAAQLIAHDAIDVKATDHPEHIDFLAAAGHKAYAPFGSAFLLAPAEVCDAAEPYMPGGGTVTWVTEDSVQYASGADRHQGGTPNIAGAIGFAAALRWLGSIGLDNIREHERELAAYGLKRFREIENQHDVTLYGPRESHDKLAVFPFNIGDRQHALVSAILNFEGAVATRNGCFCAHPYLHHLLGLGDTAEYTAPLSRGEMVALPGAVRASCGIYNTTEDLDALFDMIEVIAMGKEGGAYNLGEEEFCKPVDFTYPRAELEMVANANVERYA